MHLSLLFLVHFAWADTPRCEIERREIDDQDTLICTAYGNPVEVSTVSVAITGRCPERRTEKNVCENVQNGKQKKTNGNNAKRDWCHV